MSEKNIAIKIAALKGYTIDSSGNVFGKKGNKLSLRLNNNGYFTFGVSSVNGKRIKCAVHRFQAYKKFSNSLFEAGIVVRHLNGNPLDNSIDNISIGTQSENMMDIPKEKRVLNASNPKHDHKSILNDRWNGMTYLQLMSKYNIRSKGTISFIVRKSLKSLDLK